MKKKVQEDSNEVVKPSLGQCEYFRILVKMSVYLSISLTPCSLTGTSLQGVAEAEVSSSLPILALRFLKMSQNGTTLQVSDECTVFINPVEWSLAQ